MKTIPINTPADFESVACDMLNDFVDSYSFDNGCLGYISFHEDIQCLSRKGERLYERYVLRLSNIGQRLFPGADMKIEASNLTEDIDYETWN